MKLIAVLTFLIMWMTAASGQDTLPGLFTDPITGCQVLDIYHDSTYNMRWSGKCEDRLATGYGTLSWAKNGAAAGTYTGGMKKGRPVGKGDYRLEGGMRLKGNFKQGQLLDLGPEYLLLLHRQRMPGIDTARNYVHDEGQEELFYYALVPVKVKAVLVLINGSWETAEHNISSNKLLCQFAADNGIAVLVPSLNQRLAMTKPVVQFLDDCFGDAIGRYHLPADRFVLGGWSMGGLFSLRYTALAYEDSSAVAVKPRAVFSVDGPVDLAGLHAKWTYDLQNLRNPNKYEPAYALRELEQNIGGSPATHPAQYVYYSVYAHDRQDGGTARQLLQVPLRIYNDVDVAWWINNRGTDLYGMNALDQSAMINYLNGAGNNRAEFINAFGKGYRLEGFRHPHSWSVVDPEECISWMLECLK
jgi:hypothetical protein